ncbi:hypothetical protein NDA16_003607 [Ustilago loliicola]|nr:hypothetical protein NDA16_003607 [Ustilago loliicola]
MAAETVESSTSGPTLPADDDVQIAFLRSISLRRPIGPHKHFKMLAVLMDTQKALDTRYQRLSARLEKLSSAAPPSIATDKKAKPPSSNSTSGTITASRSRRGLARKGSRSRSGSVASSNPAEEDGDRTEDDAEQNEEEERERQQETEETRMAIAGLGLDRKVSPEMIWNELHMLFDLEALDEMEEGAIFDTSSQAGTSTDAGDSSSSDSTPHSSPSANKRKRSTESDANKARQLPAEVLSRFVVEHPGSPDFNHDRQRKSRASSSQQSQNWIYGDDIRGTGDGMSKRDFYLWPWEDFEPLIAERCLAKTEEEERGTSSSISRRNSVATADASTADKKPKRSASPAATSADVKDESKQGSDKEEEAEDEDLSEPESDADVSKDSTPKRRFTRRGQDTAESKKKSTRGRSEARDTAEAHSDEEEEAEKTKAEDDAEEDDESGEDKDETEQISTRRGTRKAPTPSNRASRRKITSGTVTPTRSTRRSRRAGNDEAEASEDETANEQKAEASEEEEEEEATQSEAENAASRRRSSKAQATASTRKVSKKRGAPSSDEEDQDSRPSVRRRSSRRASKSDVNEDAEDEEMADAKEEQSDGASEAASQAGSDGEEEGNEDNEQGSDEDSVKPIISDSSGFKLEKRKQRQAAGPNIDAYTSHTCGSKGDNKKLCFVGCEEHSTHASSLRSSPICHLSVECKTF